MPMSPNSLKSEVLKYLQSQKIWDTSFSTDKDGKVTRSSSPVAKPVSPELEELVEAFAWAICKCMATEGVALGSSTAEMLDVSPGTATPNKIPYPGKATPGSPKPSGGGI